MFWAVNTLISVEEYVPHLDTRTFENLEWDGSVMRVRHVHMTRQPLDLGINSGHIYVTRARKITAIVNSK